MQGSRGGAWLLLAALCGLLSCSRYDGAARRGNNSGPSKSSRGAEQVLLITIGTKTYPAALFDNTATRQLRGILPLRLTLNDQSGNEKSATLAARLPIELAKPQQVQVGDLLLRGPDTLVLFYQSFPTTYRYTPLARIIDPTGLATTLGPGPIEVTLELQP